MKLDTKALSRFMAKVSKPDGEDGCWNWTGGNNGGYGAFWKAGKNVSAHRTSYEHFVGPIPNGLQIDHLCRNKGCVNPKHLEPVTGLENIHRCPDHNANKTVCPKGHPLDLVYRDGGRRCRTCVTEDNKRRQKTEKVRAYRREWMRKKRAQIKEEAGLSLAIPNHLKTHCPNGHEYNEENTRHYVHPNGRRGRFCRACFREDQRKRREQARAMGASK